MYNMLYIYIYVYIVFCTKKKKTHIINANWIVRFFFRLRITNELRLKLYDFSSTAFPSKRVNYKSSRFKVDGKPASLFNITKLLCFQYPYSIVYNFVFVFRRKNETKNVQ